MDDPKDPQNDEHIEDLLSQLQGIFGKLSQSDENDSDEKVEPPPPERPSTPPPLPNAPVMEPSPSGAPPIPDFESPAPNDPPPIPDVVAPVPEEVVTPPAVTEPPRALPTVEIPPAVAAPTPPPAASPELIIPPMPPMEGENAVVPTAVYYPTGQEAAAKMLAQKLETMAPKFTRVAFQLRVAISLPYDPKGDPREFILNQNVQQSVRALFCVVERPMDEPRKKALTAQLEPRGVYFQDVPLLSIEKKAFYTDLLLGLVFFFDSLKSSAERAEGREN